VSYPDSKVERPVKALKGFRRVHIPEGQSVKVSIPLKAEDLAYWNESQHAFVLEKGNILLMIGAASDDIRLTGKIEAL
jgi:beta-glucosidase